MECFLLVGPSRNSRIGICADCTITTALPVTLIMQRQRVSLSEGIDMRCSYFVTVLLFSLELTGGCNKYNVQLPREPNIITPQFIWIDGRPPAQKESGYEALFSTNCAYGIYRIGDDKFNPDRVELLRSDIGAAMKNSLDGKVVTLKNYVVHINRAKEFRSSVANTGKGVAGGEVGLIPSLMNDVSIHGCSPDDLQGGYDSAEVSSEQSAFVVVVIDVEVDCRQVHARWVAGAPASVQSFQEKDQNWNEWVSGAIDSATSSLALKLQTGLGGTVAGCEHS